VDVAILHEIVRVVQANGVVPEKVRVVNRSYEITYLDDHRHTDRLGMLFGQLTSKVKYQLLKERAAPKKRPRVPGRAVPSHAKPSGAKKTAPRRTRARTK